METASSVLAMIRAGRRSGWGAFKISTSFTWAEVFGSMQGNEWDEITLEMLENAVRKAGWMQAQRDRYGAIMVTSWLRPPSYNRRIGGASQSSHLQGHAVDWIPLKASMKQVFRELQAQRPAGGIAMRAGSFIHTDMRGTYTTWSY